MLNHAKSCYLNDMSLSQQSNKFNLVDMLTLTGYFFVRTMIKPNNYRTCSLD